MHLITFAIKLMLTQNVNPDDVMPSRKFNP